MELCLRACAVFMKGGASAGLHLTTASLGIQNRALDGERDSAHQLALDELGSYITVRIFLRAPGDDNS